MRYIGNKESLVDTIYQVILDQNIKGSSFFDFFAGTSSVGKFFKRKGYQIYSSDLLYLSFVLQMAYIENDEEPTFSKLIDHIGIKKNLLFFNPLENIVEFLNTALTPQEGFIFKNYTPEGSQSLEIPRMYFSNENGKIIDSIRLQIEEWKKEDLISKNEYFILLACLIETVPYYSNISGVYAAFQKKWDPRAIKKLQLRPIEIITNKRKNKAFIQNSVDLLDKIEADIFYLDPPYNQRQYAPNYHLLETIALYDSPDIKGVSGMRPYDKQKSQFCNADTALLSLQTIANKSKCKTLIIRVVAT